MYNDIKYYNVHNILKIKTNISTFIPDYFRDDHIDNPDLEFIVTKLPEFNIPMKQTGVFWHGISDDDKSLYIRYKLPYGNARLVFTDLEGQTKVHFTKGYYKYGKLNDLFERIFFIKLLQRGYALIHSASIARDDKAYLITALRDTGKTSTVLSLLEHGFKFMSDDLTIVSPDGYAYCFPEPVSLSSFTIPGIINKKPSPTDKIKHYISKSRFEIVFGDILKLDMTKKVSLPPQLITNKTFIDKIFLLSTGKDGIYETRRHDLVLSKIASPTLELFSPYSNYLIVFYCNLFNYNLIRLMDKYISILHDAIKSSICYEVKSYDVTYADKIRRVLH